MTGVQTCALPIFNLYDRPYAKDLYLSMGGLKEGNWDTAGIDTTYNHEYESFNHNHGASSIAYKLIKHLGNEVFEKFKKIIHRIPDVVDSDIFNEYYMCSRINMPGWLDSCLNIVTEPVIEDVGFISEKIFKPLRAEQLFIIQGCPGTVDYLRNIGFDTFDDYINHNLYDHELDWIKRIDLSLQVLDDIYQDIPKIFDATKKRRENNRKYLQSQALDDLL